jgi:hypothetical protein
VDTNTTAPGAGVNFANFNYFHISGNTVAFSAAPSGQGSSTGLYSSSANGGSIIRLADNTTPNPQGTGTLNGFIQASVSGSKVTFTAGIVGGGGANGIYAVDAGGGNISRIADSNMNVPGGVGTLNLVGPSALSGNTVMLQGNSTGAYVSGTGIYTAPVSGEGPITKLIAAGDILDGKTVSTLSMSRYGNDGSVYAFAATFTDGTTAVYTFIPVPEPTGLLPFSVAAAAGAFAAGRWLFRGF